MFARPKSGESEEDILKFQEEFLRNTKPTPSATVLRKRKSGDEHEGNSGTYTPDMR